MRIPPPATMWRRNAFAETEGLMVRNRNKGDKHPSTRTGIGFRCIHFFLWRGLMYDVVDKIGSGKPRSFKRG